VTKNGKNIFPEEVELYLSKCDYIKEVVVWGVMTRKRGHRRPGRDLPDREPSRSGSARYQRRNCGES